MPPVTVVIADDVPEIRLLLRVTLEIEPGLAVVGEAENGVEAVRLAGETRPELVVLDLAMPVMDGLEAIPLIRRESPDSKIVVFSAFDAARMEQQALELGAAAYLEKIVALDSLPETLLRIARAPSS